MAEIIPRQAQQSESTVLRMWSNEMIARLGRSLSKPLAQAAWEATQRRVVRVGRWTVLRRR